VPGLVTSNYYAGIIIIRSEEKEWLQKPRHRWMEDIELDVKEMRCEVIY
jgi:hypothetical protein